MDGPTQSGPSGSSDANRFPSNQPCQKAIQTVQDEVEKLSTGNQITKLVEELMSSICVYLSDDLALQHGAQGISQESMELRFKAVVDKMRICSKQQDCVAYLDICQNVQTGFETRVKEFFAKQDAAVKDQKNRDKEKEKIKEAEWQKWHNYLDTKFAEQAALVTGGDGVDAGLRKKASKVDILQDEKDTLQQLLDKANAAIVDLHRETETKTSEIRKLQNEAQGLSKGGPATPTRSSSSDKSPVTPSSATASSPTRAGLTDPKYKETSQKLMEAQRKLLDANKLTNQAEQARREAEQEADALRREKAELQRELQQERASLTAQADAAAAQLLSLQEAYGHVEAKLEKSLEANATLYEELCEAKGNLRVVARVRPPLRAPAEEVDDIETRQGELVDEPQYLGIPNPNHQSLMSSQRREAPPKEYLGQFERVFDQSATNADIFGEVAPVIGSAFSGKSVCVFAYGQSGSGKTYTIGTAAETSSLEDGGVIPRTMSMLNEWIHKHQETWRYRVHAQFLEIYAEAVYDLLEGQRTEVELKFQQAPGKPQAFYYADCSSVEVTRDGALDIEAVEMVLQEAAKKRVVRSTVKNDQSSRSHSVLTLKIEGTRNGGAGADGKEHMTEGTLNLIDLAGSEKFSGDKLSAAEGIQINKSLLALRKVIGDMANPKATRTSFRESTLTKLLEPCLGKGSKVIMLAMVSPLIKDREETRNTLRFAQSATQAKIQTLRAPNNLSGSASASASASSPTQAPRTPPNRSRIPAAPGAPARPPPGRASSVQRTPPSLSIPKPSTAVSRGGAARGANAPSASASPRTPQTNLADALSSLRSTDAQSASRFREDRKNSQGEQPRPSFVDNSNRHHDPPLSPSSFRQRIASAQGNYSRSNNNDDDDDDDEYNDNDDGRPAAPPKTPITTSTARGSGRLPRPTASKLGRSNATRDPRRGSAAPGMPKESKLPKKP